MPRVTVTAVPRKDFKGFGAIKRYFLNETPETIDVSDAEYAELTSEPAKFFLKVEDAPADPDEPKKKK
jgi:hypothetical protein